MVFPTIRNRHGGLVVIYTENAGGERPIHGAYLAKDGDNNVWIPCSWQLNGPDAVYKLGRESGLDLLSFNKQKEESGNAQISQTQTTPIQE